MEHGHKVSCVLCRRSEETDVTGALSTKDQITAHQNCLLFSSGIYCRNSPQFDDLFGFSVEDVLEEVKRGKKLACKGCKRTGATAGCEERRCKKSYHYPCAVQEGAHIIEDPDNGNYGLYCVTHYEKMQNKKSSKDDNNEIVSSKECCLTCEKTEGTISLDSLSNSIFVSYCDKHAPSSHKRNGHADSAIAGPSVCSDSNSTGSPNPILPLKRKLKRNKEEETRPKRKPEDWKHRISESSDSEDAIYAPLESDLDESANSVPEDQVIRQASENGSHTGNGLMDKRGEENKDDDEITEDSEAESVSLLLPVEVCMESSSSSHSHVRPTPSLNEEDEVVTTHGTVHGPSPDNNRGISPGQHVTTPSVPLQQSPCTDATSFWRSCNAAGCTEAIFTDFIDELKDICGRIQSDQASREECDLALKVMEASGKLVELVDKRQKELKKKRLELQMAEVAMKKVVSALR